MLNYFELFNLPVSFLPPKDAVRKNYVELSKRCHPDYFAQADEGAKTNALELSAEVNKAFKIFNNQQATIKYILELKGVLRENEKYNLPPSFLMEMMEINEKITEEEQAGDPNEKESMNRRLSAIENEIYEPVAQVIENYSETTTTQEELLLVKDYYFKRKYLARIYKALDGKL
jgi:molecular chaperone HscB